MNRMLINENAFPVLTFHSVDNSGSVISVSPRIFRKLINRISEKGYKTLSLAEVVQRIISGKQLPSKHLAITFDDGFENIYKQAFPVLQEKGFCASVFLTTEYCGLKNNWEQQPPEIPILPMLTWAQVKEMSEYSFEFQAHTKSHKHLNQLPLEQAEIEIRESRTEIEDRLGYAADLFAYPYGSTSPEIVQLVKKHFKGAFSVKLDFIYPTSDIFLLPRIDMYYFSKYTTSPFFLSRSFKLYLKTRKFFREIRD